MADYKLLGKNYQTPDLYAKVTGRSKYAEDFRAEGMVFCKLLVSPMPHARVRNIDARAALATPCPRRTGTPWRKATPAPADESPALPQAGPVRRNQKGRGPTQKAGACIIRTYVGMYASMYV